MSARKFEINSLESAFGALGPLLDLIIDAKSIHDLAECLLDILRNHIEFNSTGFYFLNPSTNKLELILAHGLTEEERKHAEETVMERHPGKVFLEQKPYFSNNESFDKMGSDRLSRIRSRIYCPLIYQHKCIGAIGVASEKLNNFTSEHLQFLQFGARIATVVYEKIISQNSLEVNEERLNLAKEALNFGVWDWDIKKNNLIWDDFMYHLFEIDKEDFSQAYEAFEHTLHPEDKERVQNDLRNTFVNKNKYFENEFRVLTKDKKVKQIAAKAKCIFDGEGNVERLVGANWDITLIRTTEAKLLQSAKMSSLGEMASGIAHEINNPLTIIRGLNQAISRKIEEKQFEPEKLSKNLNKIDENIERISAIINGLRVYGHGGQGIELINTQLSELMVNTIALCESRIKNESIKFKCSEIPEDIFILCNPTQISQVIVNLLNNAMDAIAEQPEKWIQIEVLRSGDKIQILTTDSGFGIPKEVQEKMFNPFFTTKPLGKGTGLGLSISIGLIKNNNGVIYIDNSCPHTRFVIELKAN